MKTWKLIKLNRVNLLLLSAALLLVALAGTMATRGAWIKLRSKASFLLGAQTAVMVQTTPVNATFTVRNYGGKCLEFGVPSRRFDPTPRGYPVFISDCNATATQQIRVEELPGLGHLVILRAGGRVIGAKPGTVLTQDGSAATPSNTGIADQTPLEVQDFTNSPGQIFALDGDSIILNANRNLVVEAQNGRGKNRTPLVLGRRDLDDSEFWTFTATDGSNKRPTSGFKRVSQAHELTTLLPQYPHTVPKEAQAQPGTVIEVDPDVSIDLTGLVLRIPAGVTIRGDRRGTRPGPELWTGAAASWTMLEIAGDGVRVTGLRLRGPSRSTDGDGPASKGIYARSDLYARSIIDHNDLSEWTDQAVDVWGDDQQPAVCRDYRDPRKFRPQNVRVARNFIHHNQKQNAGYGVQAHYGGFPLIEGNTFVSNRHAIMADGKACTSYLAWYNLVLSEAPWQRRFGLPWWHTQDFDVHGTGDNGFGGHAGQYFEIARNTFLGDNRANFDLRGEPAILAEFHHNVSLRMNHKDAVECTDCGEGINKLKVSDTNQFNAPNPTNNIGVGDFDGDGLDDLFLATGAAWYYASAAKAEWRFINARTEKIASLLFGDFDADGRTDVFTQHGTNWDVSWGGASKWEKINQSAEPMRDYYVGDFVGDERADVFYADGSEWYISDGGVSPFTPLNTSGFSLPNLRFGDFDADGKTDVFGVVTGKWQVSYGGTSGWQPLRTRLSNSVANLTVADFDGNGRADVATSSCSSACVWMVSYNGTDNWTTLRAAAQPLASAVAIGRFDDTAGADVLTWRGNPLDISAGGMGALVRQSRQDMR